MPGGAVAKALNSFWLWRHPSVGLRLFKAQGPKRVPGTNSIPSSVSRQTMASPVAKKEDKLTTKSEKNDQKNGAEEKPKETTVEFLSSLSAVLVTGLFIITFVMQAFEIPSSSMENTLL